MGTRADFYIGRGKDAEWLGSIAWDGYPSGITPTKRDTVAIVMKDNYTEGHLFDAKTPEEFKARLEELFAGREDVTRPEMGWPWPWDDSGTTDYAYAFDGDVVVASCFGSEWFNPRHEPEEPTDGPKVQFPNMVERKNFTLGKRSGVIVVGGPQ